MPIMTDVIDRSEKNKIFSDIVQREKKKSKDYYQFIALLHLRQARLALLIDKDVETSELVQSVIDTLESKKNKKVEELNYA